MLKYLYDKARGSRSFWVCCQYTGEEVARVGRACLKWVPVVPETLSLYREETLARLIQAAGENQGIPVSGQAARLLASALTAPELASCRRPPADPAPAPGGQGRQPDVRKNQRHIGRQGNQRRKSRREIIAAEKSAGRGHRGGCQSLLEEPASLSA